MCVVFMICVRGYKDLVRGEGNASGSAEIFLRIFTFCLALIGDFSSAAWCVGRAWIAGLSIVIEPAILGVEDLSFW